MSIETAKILMKLDKEKLDTKLAVQCSPVIAGIKQSNLFAADPETMGELYMILSDTPIRMFVLCRCAEKVWVLLYREDHLQAYLNRPDVCKIFKERGYEDLSLRKVLPKLRRKYSDHVKNRGSFPHELGLVLGYPVCDVTGFMKHGGRNFRKNGYWKVYGDTEKAEAIFSRYDMVRDAAVRLLASNRSVLELMKVCP